VPPNNLLQPTVLPLLGSVSTAAEFLAFMQVSTRILYRFFVNMAA